MNNPTKRQRFAPLIGTTDGAARPRKAAALSEHQKKQQQELRSTWNLLSAMGRKLSAREMARTFGISLSVPGQYLSGAIPLNIEAMMRFSQYMRVAPQDTWSDWPYQEMTWDPSLLMLATEWRKLDLTTRDAVVGVIKSNGSIRQVSPD